jgi:hypothetical protein
VNLDRDFQSIVAAKLGPASLAALLTQQDPATMAEGTGRRIQKEIMQIVFGEQKKALKGLSHETDLATKNKADPCMVRIRNPEKIVFCF